MRKHPLISDEELAAGAMTWPLDDLKRSLFAVTIRRMAWLVTRQRYATVDQAIDALRVARGEAA